MSKKLAICDAFKAARENKGLTQLQLAKNAGITPAAISQIESGDRIPGLLTVIKIADVLQISIDALIGRSKETLYETSTIDKLFLELKQFTRARG